MQSFSLMNVIIQNCLFDIFFPRKILPKSSSLNRLHISLEAMVDLGRFFQFNLAGRFCHAWLKLITIKKQQTDLAQGIKRLEGDIA